MISSLSSYHFHNLPHNYTCWTLNTILTDNGTKCCYCMEYILSPHIKGMQHHKLGYLVTTIQSKLFTLESKWMKSLGIVQYTTCTHIQGNSDREKKKKRISKSQDQGWPSIFLSSTLRKLTSSRICFSRLNFSRLILCSTCSQLS